MGKYDRQTLHTLEQIKRRGASVLWFKLTPTLPDDETPWKETAGEAIAKPVSILFLPMSNIGGSSASRGDKSASYAKDGESKTSKKRGLMGSVPFEVELGDFIELRGERLTVSGFDEFGPDGETILYEIEFSK